MIPLLPRMSDDDIRAYALAREMPLVIDDSVPLYQVDEGEEGYSTARSTSTPSAWSSFTSARWPAS